MYQGFIDLDELVLRCRDKESRQFIQEAVVCYRAGAFRSCIVSTWNAVVFDFLNKLRELDLFGDKQSKLLLEEFDNLRSSGKDFKKLWKFESDIAKNALNLELISTLEQSDIIRLFEDRSRCAHPSMTSLEEPFEASAELARYHLRSAVTHLLQHPPVQGNAALQKIFQDVKSTYFPNETVSAIEYFKKSPLARARPTLIKSVVIGLTKSLLSENFSLEERSRMFSALNAVFKMYPAEKQKILEIKLSDIILGVNDENWYQVIIYIERTETFDSVNTQCVLKAQNYIKKLELNSKRNYWLLQKASHIIFLKETVKKKLHISLEELISLSLEAKFTDPIFKEEILFPTLQELSKDLILDELLLKIYSLTNWQAIPNELLHSILKDKVSTTKVSQLIDTFSNSGDWTSAEVNIRPLIIVAESFNPQQWNDILNAFIANSEIYNSHACISNFESLFKRSFELSGEIQPYWIPFRNSLKSIQASSYTGDQNIKSLEQVLGYYQGLA